MDKIETIETPMSDDVRYVGKIYTDPGSEDPRQWGSLGNISVFDNRTSFWRYMEDTFGKHARASVDSLVEGNVVWKGPGGMKPVIGIERYSHSGDAYAACKKGNFPDRQWDVSPIVGIYEVTDKELLKEVRKLKREGKVSEAESVLHERCKSDLEIFNQWCSGEIYYFQLERHEGNSVEEVDGCGGIYGLDETRRMMEEARLADVSSKEAAPAAPKTKARM